jgi:hypothetical protein
MNGSLSPPLWLDSENTRNRYNFEAERIAGKLYLRIHVYTYRTLLAYLKIAYLTCVDLGNSAPRKALRIK